MKGHRKVNRAAIDLWEWGRDKRVLLQPSGRTIAGLSSPRIRNRWRRRFRQQIRTEMIEGQPRPRTAMYFSAQAADRTAKGLTLSPFFVPAAC